MTFIDQYLLLVMIALPFAGALIIAFVPRDRPQDAHRLVRVVATVGLPLSVYAFFAYDSAQGGLQLTQQFDWLPSLGVTFSLGLTGITAPLFLLTGVVFFCGVLVSWNVQDRSKEFFLWLMLLVTGVYGVFASVDLFFFFFFYELAVVPMYLLIGVWGSTTDFGAFVRTKEYGALKLVLYLVAGSVLVWVAIIAMWVEGGHTLSMLELEQASFSRSFQIIFFPLIMVGFGILAGLWPFHTWSPDGHVAAPTAVSMLHAGVLMKLGAFGILRVGMVLLPEGAQVWAPVLIGLGTVNVMYGAVSALAQRDLKYVVGYSSVSHMGYVLMGLATLNVTGINGAVLQMFSHGIMTALFFALVGFIYDRAHVRDIGVLEGLAKRMGVTASFFAVAGLASLGLPGLSGFVAEFLVFLGTFQTYPVAGVFAVIGAAITAVYILRLVAKVFFGPLDPRWAGLTDATRLELGATTLLVFFLALWGLYPWYIMKVIDSAVVPVVAAIGG